MRIKLSLWLMAFLTCILIASTSILYHYFKIGSIESLEIRLINYSDNISLSIAENPAAFSKNPEAFIYPANQNEFISGSILVQFMDRYGHLLAKSPSLTNQELPYAHNEDNYLQDIEFSDGVRLKVYQDKLIVNQHLWGYIIVAIPTSHTYSNLVRLRNLMIITMAITVLVLSVGIYALVGVNILQNQKLFLSFASHELRTPLAIILGHAEITLRKKQPESVYVDTLTLIQQEAEWMSKLVSNLLFIFRSQSGSEKMVIQDVDVSELITEIIGHLKPLYPEKNITLTLPDNPIIQIDPDRFKQVITNLIENAAKNTAPNGHISITVSKTTKKTILEVKDDGIGIEKKKQRKIFNTFYRVDQNSKGGMGLGLAISKWIVKSHKGCISVQSEPGKGSTFRVEIPQKNFNL